MSSVAAVAPTGIGRMAGHRLWMRVAALLSLLLLGLWALRPTVRVDIAPDRIRSVADLPYAAPAPVPVFPYVVPGDDTFAPDRSNLIVYENGKELGPGHAHHDRIRDVGRGAYSHWGWTVLFSSSDNTDPRTNGRLYRFETRAEPSPLVLWPGLLLAAGAAALALRDWRPRSSAEHAGPFDLGGLAGCLQLAFQAVLPIAAITSAFWGLTYLAHRHDAGRSVRNNIDTAIIQEQLRRAVESPPADLAFIGDSSCLFGIDPSVLRQIFPGKSIENFCTTAYVGPAGYGIQIAQMLERGTLPKKIVIYLNPVQFGRHPDWNVWTETVWYASQAQAMQPRVDRAPAAALDYARRAWIEHVFYHPLPGAYALFYGGSEVLLKSMEKGHGFLVNAQGVGFGTPESMVEFYRDRPAEPAVSGSFATTAAFDESLEGLIGPLEKLDRENVFLLMAPLQNPLGDEALVELERKTQWIAAKLGLSPNNIIRSPAYLPSYLFSDGLHPNRWGSVLVTRELAKYLPPL